MSACTSKVESCACDCCADDNTSRVKFLLTVPISDPTWQPHSANSPLPGARKFKSWLLASQVAWEENRMSLQQPAIPGHWCGWSVIVNRGGKRGVLTIGISMADRPSDPADFPLCVERVEMPLHEFGRMLFNRNARQLQEGRWTFVVRRIQRCGKPAIGIPSPWPAQASPDVVDDSGWVAVSPETRRPSAATSERPQVTTSIFPPVAGDAGRKYYRLGRIGEHNLVHPVGGILTHDEATAAIAVNPDCVLCPVGY